MSEGNKDEKKPVKNYFVNGEPEPITQEQLSVKQILEGAGFTPATDYTLKSETRGEDFGSQYEKIVEVHENERFQATFKGPTPTSAL
jgi:hypothetical protein